MKVSKKELSPYWKALMKRDGYIEYLSTGEMVYNIAAAAKGWGIPEQSLRDLIDMDRPNKYFESLLRNSETLGISIDELVRETLKHKPRALLEES